MFLMVRQGGILSPPLFNCYIDNLSVQLRKMQSGCYVNRECYNHLMYADDMVLLSPCPRSLQKLIDTCSLYVKEKNPTL